MEPLYDLFPIIFIWRKRIISNSENERIELFGTVVTAFGSESDQETAASNGYLRPFCGACNGLGLKVILESEMDKTSDQYFKSLLNAYIKEHGKKLKDVFNKERMRGMGSTEDKIKFPIICLLHGLQKKNDKIEWQNLVPLLKRFFGIDLSKLAVTCLVSEVALLKYLGFDVVDDGKFLTKNFKNCKDGIYIQNQVKKKEGPVFFPCKAAPLLKEDEYDRQLLKDILNFWQICMEKKVKQNVVQMERFSYFAYHNGSEENQAFAYRNGCLKPLAGNFTTCKVTRLLKEELEEGDLPGFVKSQIQELLNSLSV